MLSQFLEDLLPQTGNFATWTKHNKKHTWTDSHDGLGILLEHKADTPDTYYATAAFGAEISEKTGLIARTQSNVTLRRCLHADLDCGPEKHAKNPDGTYPTQRDALAAMGAFEKATGLRFSHVVHSGAGIHAYLAFDQDIGGVQWMGLAKAFQKLAREHGLRLDDSCTTDSARVLRAPGSLHGNGQRVKLLGTRPVRYDPSDLARRIVSQLDTPVAVAVASRPRRASINEDVLSVEGPPKSLLNVARKCGAMRQALKSRGDVPEPFWRAMIGVIKYTVEGVDAAQKFSSGHPEYDPSATQEKYDRWATPPTSCAEFAKHCTACATCPHQGQIKSPIVLGVMTTPQVQTLPPEKQPEATKAPAPSGAAWDGRIPAGFKVKPIDGMSTLVWSMPVEKENGDGDSVTAYVDVPFSHDVFWFSQWADAEHSDDGAQVIACKVDGPTSFKAYTLPQTLIGNQPKLREVLAGKSIFTTTHKQASRAMEEYTKAQINRIRNIGQKPKINTRFGVRILNNGDLIAAQGDKVIYPNGEIREAILGDELKGMAQFFTLPLPDSPDGMWGPEVWDTHLLPAARQHTAFMKKYYARPGMEKFQLAAMVALASPLMPFVTGEYHKGMILPATGFSVSLYSRRGGRGKTTLMQASMLAYGVPSGLSKDANNAGSTDKARTARMTLSGSCPVGMDEMGSTTPKAIAELISAVANGSSRQGATVDGGLRTGSNWALSCILAANKSQREMIAASNSESSAIQYRMIELDVQHMPEFSKADRAEFTLDWAQVVRCAGALGAVLHRRMAELGSDKVNQLVSQAVNKAAEVIGEDQTSRFQYRVLGAVLATQMLLKQDGLTMFEMGGIVKEFKAAQEGVADFVAENLLPDNELELMSMFLDKQMESTLVTQNVTRRSGFVTTFDHAIGKDPNEVTVRHIVATRRSYINAEVFRAWCAEKALPLNAILSECVRLGAIERPAGKTARVKTYFNLLAGTSRSSGARIWCYAVNVGRLNAMLGRDDALGEDAESADVIELRRPEPPEAQVQAVENVG